MPDKLPDEIVQSIAISNAKSIEGQLAEPIPAQEISSPKTVKETIDDSKATIANLNPDGVDIPAKP